MAKIRDKLKSNIKTILTTIVATSLFNFGILSYKHHEDNKLMLNSRFDYFEILRYHNESRDFYNSLLKYMDDNNLEKINLNDKIFSKKNLIYAINDSELHIKSDLENIEKIEHILDKDSYVNYLRINKYGLQIEANYAKDNLKEVLTDNFKLWEKMKYSKY